MPKNRETFQLDELLLLFGSERLLGEELGVDYSLIGDGPLVVFGKKLEGLFYVEG